MTDLLRDELELLLNDPRTIEEFRLRIAEALAINGRRPMEGTPNAYLIFTNSLYDGDCDSIAALVVHQEFDENGTKRYAAGGRFIYCDYAVNEIGGEMIVGEYSRVCFDLGLDKTYFAKNGYNPKAKFTDMSPFQMSDDEKTNMFLKMLAARS